MTEVRRWNVRIDTTTYGTEVSHAVAWTEANDGHWMLYSDVAALQAQLAASEARVQELTAVCAEAYQVIGSLAHDVGAFATPEVVKALDNTSAAGNGLPIPHDSVLPFPAYLQLATLTEAVKGLPMVDGQIQYCTDALLGEVRLTDRRRHLGYFIDVKLADAYAKLLALRAEMGG